MGDPVEEFMRYAEGDLIVAERAYRDDLPDICSRAFHSQQAAEKAIKAVIAASGASPKYIHDLVALVDELPSGLSSASRSELETLSEYVGTGRYGGDDVSKSDADEALTIATRIVDEMRSRL